MTYSYNLANFVKTYVNLHLALEVPMKASHVRSFFRMMELLKAVHQMFHRRSMWIAKMVPHIIQFYTHRAVKQLQACHAELSKDARYGICNVNVST